jgi:glucosamine--fructose-6-phosphate aminotransferase (isomerizing)
LIDETMPVVIVAPYDKSKRREGVFEKTVSNMQEVAARGGKIILITDPKGAAEAKMPSWTTLVLPDIVLPDMATTVTPIVYAIPVQLIAYHTAVNMGTDVDQPRNLAKSVTVE